MRIGAHACTWPTRSHRHHACAVIGCVAVARELEGEAAVPEGFQPGPRRAWAEGCKGLDSTSAEAKASGRRLGLGETADEYANRRGYCAGKIRPRGGSSPRTHTRRPGQTASMPAADRGSVRDKKGRIRTVARVSAVDPRGGRCPGQVLALAVHLVLRSFPTYWIVVAAACPASREQPSSSGQGCSADSRSSAACNCPVISW